MSDPVAVVGLGCRFPGAPDPASYWELVLTQQSGIGQASPPRWADAELKAELSPAATRVNLGWGGFLPDTQTFDAQGFAISNREACDMDPQQRLLLEVAQEAMEDAGEPLGRATRTGVFIGISGTDYAFLKIKEPRHLATITAFSGTGNTHSISANRISFLFGFQGPSLAIDTACASSLTAVHLAIRGLVSGECDMAVAGGVNLILSPEVSIAFARANMLSPTGQCWTFDRRADGYVRGEGCGLLVLKRLADAERDGNRILAALYGSASNQDGYTRNITAPSAGQQEKVVRAALAAAEVSDRAISLVEAHGTGTPLGDPIEVQSLSRTFAGRGARLPITSVKANIGHLETASGIAGLIKTILALRHDTIPGQRNFEQPNPACRLAESCLEVPTAARHWRAEGVRLAGVSAYGFGGSNVHLVVGDPPNRPRRREVRDGWHVVPLSTRRPEALPELARRWSIAVNRTPPSLGDLAYTAALGRAHYPARRAVVARDLTGLREALDGVAAEAAPGAHARPSQRRIGFLFTGQGAQYAEMGASLYSQEPSFRDDIDQYDAIYRREAGQSLLKLLFEPDAAVSGIDQTGNAQPALMALELALAALWRRFGVVPHASFGHSLGEFSAACDAGMFSPDEGLVFVIRRGRLMQALPAGGAMIAVGATPGALAEILVDQDSLAIAAENGPRSTVLSGKVDAVRNAAARLEARNVPVRELHVSHAFHSPLVAPILPALREEARGLRVGEGRTTLVSGLTGAVVSAGELDPDYWAAQARQPVRFTAAVQAMQALGCDLFLEIGPHPVLTAMARSMWRGTRPAPVVAGSLIRGQDDRRAMLGSVATLYEAGVAIDWPKVNGRRGNRISLPPTPFLRSPHWLGSSPVPAGPAKPAARQPGQENRLPLPHTVIETALPPDGGPYAEHRIAGHALFPAAGMLTCMAGALQGDDNILRDVMIHASLSIPGGRGPVLQTHVREVAGVRMLELFARPDQEQAGHDGWTRLASAQAPTLRYLPARVPSYDRMAAQAEWTSVEPAQLYAGLAEHGLDYGPGFRPIVGIWADGSRVLARLVMPERARTEGASPERTILLDGAMQALAATEIMVGSAGLALPVRFEAAFLDREPGSSAWVCGALRDGTTADAPFVIADLALYGEDGTLKGALIGLVLRRAGQIAGQAGGAGHPPVLEPYWQPAPDQAPGTTGPALWLAREGGSVPAGIASLMLSADGICMADRLAEGIKAAIPGHLVIAWPAGMRAGEDAEHTLTACCLSLLRDIDAVAPTIPVVILTRGGQCAGGDRTGDKTADPVQAAIGAFALSLAQERPERLIAVLDLEPGAGWPEAAHIDRVPGLARSEKLLASRSGELLAPRLRPLALAEDRAGRRPPPGFVRLLPSQPGILDSLDLEPMEAIAEAGPGEVVIDVRSAALNFRDVLKVLNAYPGMTALQIGDECAGVVRSVGPEILDFRAGDAVIAMAPGSFASQVRAPVSLVVRKPAGLDWGAAAALPVAFATAWHSLVTLGHLEAGETILIHAAAGGVGLAAIEIATSLGARVMATVGSEEKRALLRERGVSGLFNSRSLSFIDDVLAATDGRGVDLVLNSLSGPALALGLGVLAPFGRFIEIGKRDIFENTPIGLGNFKSNQSFAAVDMDALLRARPEIGERLMRMIAERIDQGAWRHLPVTRYPASEAADAFRLMAKARHSGKIVLEFAEGNRAERHGTHLITGGFGGIGLELASWLAREGAEALVLCGRGAPSAEAESRIEALQRQGVRVWSARLDVGERDALARLLKDIRRDLPRLIGVWHLAGVLADGFADQLTEERLRMVLRPKISGAENLDQLTREDPLERFVLFSSAAGLLFPPGQANYAAANSYLDALALRRRAMGLPAASVAWGPWAERGMAARTMRQGRSSSMLRPIAPNEGFAALDACLSAGLANAAVLPIVPGVLARMGAHHAVPQRLRGLATEAVSAREAAAASSPAPHSSAGIAESITREVASLLGLPPAELDLDRPLDELGMDSLMGLELAYRLEIEHGLTLAMSALRSAPSARVLIDNAVAGIRPSDQVAGGRVSVRMSRLGQVLEGPARRLVCFCWAGGNRTGYRDWPPALDGTEVHVAELLPAAAETGLVATIAGLAELISPLIVPGVVLFGHSLGAVLCFELCRKLESDLRAAGAHIVLSGRNAPHLAQQALAGLPDREFSRQICRLGGIPDEVVADADLHAMALEAIRRDLSLISSYAAPLGTRLGLPLRVMGGRQDPNTSAEGLRAWSEYSAAGATVDLFPGGHFYFREDAAPFFQRLRGVLNGTREQVHHRADLSTCEA